MGEPSTAPARLIRAPRGPVRTCKTWHAEAALRMLMNNLDPDVAEDPAHLIVYGGRGQAARSWEAFDAIVANLRQLDVDETLLVQSARPVVGVLRTCTRRALRACSSPTRTLVPHWATWTPASTSWRGQGADHVLARRPPARGSDIGTQGIVQGTV